MRKIEPEILEKLKRKYGIQQLKRVVGLYGLGIPEKYWNTKPTQKEIELIDSIIKNIEKYNNLAIHCQDIPKGNRISSELLKRLGKINNSRYLDFVAIANEMVDRFGQLNMKLINEIQMEDVILISNIKPYGIYYTNRVYPVFASFLDSVINSTLDKKIILVMEITDGELDGIDKSYGNEMLKTLNSQFNFYQLPTWINADETT